MVRAEPRKRRDILVRASETANRSGIGARCGAIATVLDGVERGETAGRSCFAINRRAVARLEPAAFCRLATLVQRADVDERVG